jgi:hypothetical protein
MNIIAYINSIVYKYISIDSIVEYSSIVLLLLVIWSFWGKRSVVGFILKKRGKGN